MTDRERLIADLTSTHGLRGTSWTEDLADHLLLRGWKPSEPPASRPEWPGLDKAVEAYRNAPDDYECAHIVMVAGCPHCDNGVRVGLNAAAPVLWRALVNSLPASEVADGSYVCVNRQYVTRAALLALADPYDGGGK